MSNSVVMNVAIVILVCMVVSAPYAEAKITCGLIVTNLLPCRGYLRAGEALSPECCPGVQNLNKLVKTTVDRRAVCKCFKLLAGADVNPSLASGLPGKCGVKIPYPISRSVKCSKVK